MNFEYDDRNHTWNEADGAKQNVIQKCFQPKYRKTVLTIIGLGAIIGITLLVYFNVSSNTVTEEREDLKTLKLVSMLFRHGARTPTGTYDSDPYKNYDWPDGWGALTNLGKQQLHHLGETIRKRYAGFLPDDYYKKDIYIQSSDRSRTLMSAYSLLAGLYPPTPKQTWNPDIKWQPIPVHSIPREYDAIIVGKKPCPYYDKVFNEVQNSSEIKEINEKYADLYNNLTIYCNQPMNTFLQVELLYSHLEIERDNGLILPNWTKGIFPEQMEGVPGFSLAFYTYNDIMKRLKGGPLLAEIQNNMDKKLNGTLAPNRKMFLYSGHDLTIVNLWRVLTFEEIILPQFGASIVIELHDFPNSTDSEVKLLYYNSSSTVDPYTLKMQSCGPPCMMSQFKKLTEKYIPTNWDAECAANNSSTR